MWTTEQAYAYHYETVDQLSDTLRQAYEFVRRSPRPVTADELSHGISVNPLSAGQLMNELANLSLVRANGRAVTSHGGSATAYQACHPREMPPPLPAAAQQTQEQKWRALEQAALVIKYFRDNHPDGEALVGVERGDPEYAELLTLLFNIRRSVLAARRRLGEDEI